MVTPKKKTVRELDLKSLARCYTEESIRQVAAVLSNDTDTGRRLTAADMLLNRGWGRPESTTTTKHEGGESPIEFIIRNLNAEKKKE